jgi:DNA-binding beta-propeller fold protein YncE
MTVVRIARLLAGALAFLAASAFADPPGTPGALLLLDSERFATLPADVHFPEGITANPATGDIFVSTFDFNRPNRLVRLSRNGHVSAIRDFGGTPLLGLEFRGGYVYILNFGASKLQRMPANFDASTAIQDVASIPSIGSPGSRNETNPDGSSDSVTFGSNGFPAPNAMVFDHAGNLYISDSFQGAIFEVATVAGCAPACGTALLVSHDPLLATAGTPPFGANGLALSADEKTLFIANTGDHRVLQMDLTTPTHPITVFSISLHGADGLLFENGRLWVATNQADHVVALNDKGRIIIKAGEFEGLRPDGSPRGLLFPASMVVVDGWMYVTNLALPLTSDPLHADSPLNQDEPEDFVKLWTVSRFHVPK